MKRYPALASVLLASLGIVVAGRATAAPPIAQDDAFHVTCGDTVTITFAQLLANDSDPDGDPLDIPNTWILPSVTNGSVQWAGGAVEYTPDVAADGTCAASDGFPYPVIDIVNFEKASAFATITIVAANLPPVANDDAFHVTCGDTLHIPGADLLFNDNDPDGDPLAHEPTQPPQFGVLSFDGDYHYTPSAASDGCAPIPDTFGYHIGDSNGGEDEAVVTIEILSPDQPSPSPPQVDENSTTCSSADEATGAVGFQVFQSENAPGSQPILWELSDGSGVVAGGATTALAPGDQTSVDVTGLPAGTYDVVVSDGGDPALTDSMQTSVGECPVPSTTLPTTPTTTSTVTPTTTSTTPGSTPATSTPSAAVSQSGDVVAVLPATR